MVELQMVHLLEPTHNSRFVALMDMFMPNWRFHRQSLNRPPQSQLLKINPRPPSNSAQTTYKIPIPQTQAVP
jgi:hypothetical protein